MNGRQGEFSMTGSGGIARLTGVIAIASLWAGAAIAQPAAPPTDAAATAEQSAAYPTFASVPAAPKDVRTPMAWKALVVQTRLAGAHLQRLAANLPPAATDTEAWADRARQEATPPAQLTTPSGDTAALIADLRARASAPSPHR
jgi:hypothetical protein